MNSKVLRGAICAILAILLSACGSMQPVRSDRGQDYVWMPPTTGTNVGRWVARDSGDAVKRPARAKKKKRVVEEAKVKPEKKAKPRARASRAEPGVSSSPPDRFR